MVHGVHSQVLAEGEDELTTNGHGAVSRGWPAPVVMKNVSPIYHLVKTLNDETESLQMAPHMKQINLIQ